MTSPLGGDDPPLWGMQIDLEQSRAELKAAADAGGGKVGGCAGGLAGRGAPAATACGRPG